MTPIDRRDFLTLASAAAAVPTLPSGAFADAWPSEKIIRAVVPFGPGSTIDIIGRVVLDPLSSALGQTIVVENRGGAGGTIGSAMVAKVDPDGYTLLINASAHTAAPAVYPNLTYDPSKDFAGIALFGVVPNVLLVAPSKGIKSAAELVGRARERHDVCVRRRRQRYPLGGGALSAFGRHKSHSRSIQRRTRCTD
ncbi:MAG TPA: tripartite tricarboxylate transporter substrate-binding protein [Xanthobacteraceae bacterium]